MRRKAAGRKKIGKSRHPHKANCIIVESVQPKPEKIDCYRYWKVDVSTENKLNYRRIHGTSLSIIFMNPFLASPFKRICNHLFCRDINGSKCIPYDNSFEGEGREKYKDVPPEHEIMVTLLLCIYNHLVELAAVI